MTRTLLAALSALATLFLFSDPADAQKRERGWTEYTPAPTTPRREAKRSVRHAGPVIAHRKARRGKVAGGRLATAPRARSQRLHADAIEWATPAAAGRSRGAARALRFEVVEHAGTPRPATRSPRPQTVSHAGGGATGLASYYYQGHTTASGAPFNPEGMTAAHRSLPFGTRVRVTHVGNGRSVVVTINDRGPFIGGRIIDLSRGAAGVLGMHSQGVANVRMEVIGR